MLPRTTTWTFNFSDSVPCTTATDPEVHEVIRRWRKLADSFESKPVLIGETPVPIESLAGFYGDGTDELHLAFNFPFINTELSAAALERVVEDTEALLPRGSWPAWTASNHDVVRFPSRWAGGDPRKARVALFALLCLRGTPVLYQGDEIGQCDALLSKDDLKDPLGVMYWPYAGRDAARTPMPWRDGPGGGFTDPDVTAVAAHRGHIFVQRRAATIRRGIHLEALPRSHCSSTFVSRAADGWTRGDGRAGRSVGLQARRPFRGGFEHERSRCGDRGRDGHHLHFHGPAA